MLARSTKKIVPYLGLALLVVPAIVAGLIAVLMAGIVAARVEAHEEQEDESTKQLLPHAVVSMASSHIASRVGILITPALSLPLNLNSRGEGLLPVLP